MDHPEAVGEVFNIGSSEEVTIRALAERVKALTGSDSEIVHDPVREGLRRGIRGHAPAGPRYHQDRRLIGYRPRKSLDEILQGVIEFFRDAPWRPGGRRRFRSESEARVAATSRRSGP